MESLFGLQEYGATVHREILAELTGSDGKILRAKQVLPGKGGDSKPWYEKITLDFDFPFLYNTVEYSSFSFHWHESVEIIYILSGAVIISVEGKPFKAVQGDIFIINSELVHGFYDAIPDTHLDIYQFSLEFFDSALMDLRDENSQMMVFEKINRLNAGIDQTVYHLMLNLLLEIKKECKEKKAGYHLAIKLLLYQIAMVFIRQIPAPEVIPRKLKRRNCNRYILERVLSYVYENYNNPDLSLDHAAGVAALSKFYFTRFFRQQTGQTFHNYLNRIRINKAKEYLIKTNKTITDISLLCGFSSFNTFNRLFKLYTSITPSSYRIGKS
jgi:AraC-like DNA-binding protein/mannose-6-phosphate isomerase-like protein (cupin superfamily)